MDAFVPHSTLTPNGETVVCDDRAVLAVGANRFESAVSFRLRLLPTPDISVHGEFNTDKHPLELAALSLKERTGTVTIESSGDAADVYLERLAVGNPASFRVSLNGLLVTGTRAPVRAVQFHLINFPDFLAQEKGATYKNSVTLVDGQHQVSILPVVDDDTVFDELKARGGFGSAHVGVMTRLDGSDLSFDEATDAIDRVHYFLSFARGAWTGIVLPAGLDSNGAPVWRQFGIRLVDRWPQRVSWADRHNYQVLSHAYGGFSRLWSDKFWLPVLRKALYWYLRSNDPSSGIDGGIILTQAALEFAAWSYLVEHRRSLSKEGFANLYASDRLRLMLTSLGIPLEIPASLNRLREAGSDWDGPRVFTEIRNQLVHPVTRKGRFKLEKLPYYEAWTLGQWYLELSLLRIAGFDDVYRNRTRTNGWVGEVVHVPWHPPSTP
jgi:hypothetical protein